MSDAVAFFILCIGTSFGFILATLFRVSDETPDPVDAYGEAATRSPTKV